MIKFRLFSAYGEETDRIHETNLQTPRATVISKFNIEVKGFYERF